MRLNSIVYYNDFDLVVSGGTDRFINLYQSKVAQGSRTGKFDQFEDLRYNCISKLPKQGINSVINKMCSIDGDKLLVGQSDEYIRLYSLAQMGGSSTNDSSVNLPGSTPLATYHFEESGVNNICSLNDQNLFISSGINRSICVWDTKQTHPIFFFKDIHYDTITSLDKFNQQIFASASHDGYINIWDLRMGEFVKQLKVDQNERISSIKIVTTP